VDKTRIFADDNGFSMLSFLSHCLGSSFIDDDDDMRLLILRSLVGKKTGGRKENEKRKVSLN
jgi:hypothetical protein